MITAYARLSAASVKSRALFGNRLMPEDYKKLMNADSVQNIIDYLKQHPSYSFVLQKIPIQDIHRTTLEPVIREELIFEYSRILNFLTGDDRKFFKLWFHRYEITEILSFIRLLISQKPQQYTINDENPLLKNSKIPFKNFYSIVSFSSFVDLLKDTDYYHLLMPFTKKSRIDYTGIEVELRSYLMRTMMEGAKKHLPKNEAEQFKKFLGMQIDMLNFSRIVRAKRYFKQPQKHIFTYILPFTYNISSATIREMVNAPSWEQTYALIDKTAYKNYFKEHHFELVEHYYYNLLYKTSKNLIHLSSPSVIIPLAYIHFKEIEAKDLINIIECVVYKILPNQMTKYMIASELGGQEDVG